MSETRQETITLWHNPRCSKSRQAKALLEERGVPLELRLYLEKPPSVKELEDLLHKLGAESLDLILRKKEALYKELGLEGKPREEVLQAIAEHPKLLERPIAVRGKQARMGRPPEKVLELLA
ncbi:MAG TPA: arsenate reductase (glutaredoxin) [Planctomycetes bacterium]|nr:arsenate reductase (glutaredoxin) [Planctomycetota bacterium]